MTTRTKLIWAWMLISGIVLSVAVHKAHGQDLPLSQLPTIVSVPGEDLFYVVDDPAGTPTSKKVAFTDLARSITNITGSVTVPANVVTQNFSGNLNSLSFSGSGAGLTNIGITAFALATPTNSGVSSTNQYILGTRYDVTRKQTPPMGFNGYPISGPFFTEAQMLGTMDFFITNNWRQMGYEYFNLDEGWAASNRLANGHLTFDPTKFPNSPNILVQHAHTNGFRMGLWEEVGVTVDGFPVPRAGSGTMPSMFGYYEQDVQDFTDWGFDYFKLDGGADINMTHVANAAKAANYRVILETGRVDLNSGVHQDVNISRPSGKYGDVTSWNILWQWMDDYSFNHSSYGPSHWAYVDIIQNVWGDALGNVAVKKKNIHAQMSMAAMISSPIIISDFNFAGAYYYTNRDVIAADQDFLVICAEKIYSNNLVEIYSKKSGVYPTSKYVALVNRDANPHNITVTVDPQTVPGGVFSVRDLWAQSYVAYATNTWTTNVDTHDVALLRVDPGTVAPYPYGTNYLSDFHFMPIWTNAFYTNGIGGGGGGGGFFDTPIMLNTSANQTPIRLGGTNYAKGFGASGNAEFKYFLGKQASIFHFTGGCDDEVAPGGGFIWQIYGDGVLLATTTTLIATNPVANGVFWTTNINVSGVTILGIKATSTQTGGGIINLHADLADAYIVCPLPAYGPASTNGGSGSVTSVAISAPGTGLTVGGSPVTTTGTLSLSSKGFILTNGMDQAVTVSNNFTVDPMHSFITSTGNVGTIVVSNSITVSGPVIATNGFSSDSTHWSIMPTNNGTAGQMLGVTNASGNTNYLAFLPAPTGGSGGTNSRPITLTVANAQVNIPCATPVGVSTNSVLPFRLTLTANTTITNATGMADGQVIRLQVIQNSTGNWTLGFWNGFTNGSPANTSYGSNSYSANMTGTYISTNGNSISTMVWEYYAPTTTWMLRANDWGN